MEVLYGGGRAHEVSLVMGSAQLHGLVSLRAVDALDVDRALVDVLALEDDLLPCERIYMSEWGWAGLGERE